MTSAATPFSKVRSVEEIAQDLEELNWELAAIQDKTLALLRETIVGTWYRRPTKTTVIDYRVQ
jgi:hypothetical protein